MAGYNNYSMSNNAVAAYESGEKPLSKWTKAELVSALSEVLPEDILKKIKVSVLKERFLKKTSYHHTSCRYNKTDFYSVDYSKAEMFTVEDLEKLINIKKEEPTEVVEEAWECCFLEWSGSLKHPKAKEVKEIGTIKGNWFYRADGTKKSINAKGFYKIKKI